LSFTSDLFIQTQLARSWLEGHFLHDNCYGPHLGVHTYFFLPVLGLLAKPLGAPGLFVALAAAVALSAFLAHRILRLLGVPARQEPRCTVSARCSPSSSGAAPAGSRSRSDTSGRCCSSPARSGCSSCGLGSRRSAS